MLILYTNYTICGQSCGQKEEASRELFSFTGVHCAAQ